jgi:membrane protease YdiL (CAAX protease family)
MVLLNSMDADQSGIKRGPILGALLVFLCPAALGFGWSFIWLICSVSLVLLSKNMRRNGGEPILATLLFFSLAFWAAPQIAQDWAGFISVPVLLFLFVRFRRILPATAPGVRPRQELTIPVFAAALVCLSVAASFYLMILNSQPQSFQNFVPELRGSDKRWQLFFLACSISVTFGLAQEVLVRGWLWWSFERYWPSSGLLLAFITSGFCLVTHQLEPGVTGLLAMVVVLFFHLGQGWLRNHSNGLFWPCISRASYEFLLVTLLFLLDR